MSRSVECRRLAVIVAACCVSAQAATFFVSTAGSDNLTCGLGKGAQACRTIQYTLDNRARGGDTLAIARGVYSENLTIAESVALQGVPAGGTIVDGGHNGTVALIRAAASVTFLNLTLRNGHTRNLGGGILNHGTLTLVRSIVTENSARIADERPGQGGGIYNTGALALVQSTVSNNTATEAGGLFNLGSIFISDSTISGNLSESYGGGMETFGPVRISNSTFSGNEAIYGGAVDNDGSLVLASSTVSGNSALSAGGLYNEPYSRSTITLKNTIVAGNSTNYSDPDCEGTLTSEDFNLFGDLSGCSVALGPHDKAGVAPGLGALGDNGGPTQTMALLPGSPAIDAGNAAGCTKQNGVLLTTDQRGFLRPSPRGGWCDIGSFELQQ